MLHLLQQGIGVLPLRAGCIGCNHRWTASRGKAEGRKKRLHPVALVAAGKRGIPLSAWVLVKARGMNGPNGLPLLMWAILSESKTSERRIGKGS